MEEISKFFDGDDAIDVGEVAQADMKERGMGMAGDNEKSSVTTQIEVSK
jgi:hypothetical protein